MSARRSVLQVAIAAAVWSAAFAGCSLGEGRGQVSGALDAPPCWRGPFNLNPDFFGAVPYRKASLLIRVQSSGDYQNFSDGLTLLVDDLQTVRSSLLGKPLRVDLSPEVTPPGIPLRVDPDPALVHAVLYLQRSCRTTTTALHAVTEVSLDSGDCGEAGEGGAPPAGLDGGTCTPTGQADAAAPPPPPPPSRTGRSTITFHALQSGDPDESDAQQRQNTATFDLYLADPREQCAATLNRPPPCRGHIKGFFDFYFQRGRPAQPFP